MPIESGFHLAQLNIALPCQPIDSPLLAEFVALLDPGVAEAEERLVHLREHGPTPYAFTFKAQFRPGQRLLIEDEIGCPA